MRKFTHNNDIHFIGRGNKMIKFKNYIISLIISIGIGQISGFLTKNASKNFSSNFNQSALTPPDWVFPVVWVILFFLMGISATLVYESHCKYKKYGLLIYGVQLIFNFLWSMFFFLGEQFVLSFGWLTILILMVVGMILLFYKCNKIAGYLQIPYLVWLCFAMYLNYIVVILN